MPRRWCEWPSSVLRACRNGAIIRNDFECRSTRSHTSHITSHHITSTHASAHTNFKETHLMCTICVTALQSLTIWSSTPCTLACTSDEIKSHNSSILLGQPVLTASPDALSGMKTWQSKKCEFPGPRGQQKCHLLPYLLHIRAFPT